MLLRFNTEKKCTTVHIGKNFSSTYYLYEGNDTIDLSATHCERDLGVHVQNNWKWSDQCRKAAAKGSSILGLIRRHFKHLDTEFFLILYKTYVRPHQEYCIQLWCPTLVKDIDCLEQIQRRATKLVHSIKDLSYSEQLQKLRLTTLKTRRLRGDLIETYKIITGKERIDPQHLFTFANPPYGLREHSLKLYKPAVYTRLNIRKNFFSQRVIDHWNKLPQYVDAPSTNSFKNRLDKHRSKSDNGHLKLGFLAHYSTSTSTSKLSRITPRLNILCSV